MRCELPVVYIIVSCLTAGSWVLGLEQTSIPEYLLSCYRNRPPQLPKTMDTLIEIIRKIERRHDINMDMRMLANVLLHKFRLDGIEKDPNVAQNTPGVVPYRISGFQAFRQQILLKYLIPDNAAYFPLNILTETEKCNLHWLLSSAVDPWERGDEIRSCPQSNIGYMPSPQQRFGAKLSSCPEELGVVYQEHGTLNPGTVIAAIAAGLSPSQVQQAAILSTYESQLKPIGWNAPTLNENIVNNTHVATLAGSLAEVIQFQAANVTDIYFGPSGTWNDTYVPTAYYFTSLDYNRIERKAWEMSDAEIIGGVDGLVLSGQVLSLSNKIRNVRLSQVLEMYYSDRGLVADTNLRACNREMNAAYFINREKQTLLSQVETFANVLAAKVPKFITDPNFIYMASRQAIDKFTPYLTDVMRKSRCMPRMINSEKINLYIIIDQTWTSYTTLQLVMFLSRAIDVSYYGSRLSAINGQRGSMIVQGAQNTTSVYLGWKSTTTNPYGLNLPESLITLKNDVVNSIEIEKTLAKYNSQSHIALVIGYSSTITDDDHSKAKSLISTIKSLNPDLRFVYVTSRVNSHRFVQLTALPGSQNDKIVVIDNVSNIQSFMSQLQDSLSLVPRNLIAPYCTDKKGVIESVYEEYVTPGQPVKYRIHPDYLCGSSELHVKIINWDYGDVQICTSRTEQAGGIPSQCKTLKPNEQHIFSIPKPCEKPQKKKHDADSKQQWLDSCMPVFFDVSTVSSLNRCSENECRYPDQVKFNIVVQGLRCVQPYKTICASAFIFSPDLIVIFTSLVAILVYYFT